MIAFHRISGLRSTLKDIYSNTAFPTRWSEDPLILSNGHMPMVTRSKVLLGQLVVPGQLCLLEKALF